MAYDGVTLPFESASKIAHMELIKDPALTQLLQSFTSDQDAGYPVGAVKTGTIDLSLAQNIKHIITVDGGLTIVPNPVRRDKTVAFVQVGAMVISLQDLQKIKADPMMDPRLLRDFVQRIDRYPVVLPLSGVRIPNETVKQTNRVILNAILSAPWTNLYPILEYLLWRDWLPPSASRPERSMNCYKCERLFPISRGQTIVCPHCQYVHFLSDYLGLFSNVADEWGSEQIPSMVMATIEALALWKLPVRLAQTNQLHRLREFLFIKDGPLILRAEGFRIVDSLRDFVEWLVDQGHCINLVGVEKSGGLVNFLGCYPALLAEAGDYFAPSIRFMHEEVRGGTFDPDSYRNRVSYGSRVAVRLSPHHKVVLHIPTKRMTDTGPTDPQTSDLISLDGIVAILASLTSAAHDDALLPITLVNRAVSLSDNPSNRILEDYMNQVIGKP
jgi:hypothetical protein